MSITRIKRKCRCACFVKYLYQAKHDHNMKKIDVYLFPPSDCYVEKDISKTKEISREYPEEQTEMNISMFEHINLLY